MANLKSRSLVCQQSTNSKNRESDSSPVCDTSTGYMVYDKTGIQKLNDDCLMHIFAYIPRGDRWVLEKVCKRWKIVTMHTWRTFKKFDLNEKTWGDNSTCENLRNLKIKTLQSVLYRCGSFLTHINLSERCQYWKGLNGKLVSVFAKYCTNLQHIDLENSIYTVIDEDSIRDAELSKLFLNNKKLRYVRLVNTAINGECLLNLSADSLETLVIILCSYICHHRFENAVKKFQKLHTLLIDACENLDRKTCKTMRFCRKSLKQLQLKESGGILGQKCYELLHIGKLLNLEILDIASSIYTNDKALKVIGEKCKKLKKINLSDCENISNEGLSYIVSLPELQQLDISCLSDISDEILTDMPNLRQLKCSFCRNVKNQGLCQLIQKSHNLEILDVTGCINVSNELVKVAIEATKNRTNNLTLKMYVSRTDIDVDHVTTTASPFLELSRKTILLIFFENEDSKSTAKRLSLCTY